jgi:hypothetical protein
VQDVSRLVDVCRQSIVFEELHALAACLRAIREDDEAEVSPLIWQRPSEIGIWSASCCICLARVGAARAADTIIPVPACYPIAARWSTLRCTSRTAYANLARTEQVALGCVAQVVRVKNRMDPAHDSAESGGYRDVAVGARCRTAPGNSKAAPDLGPESSLRIARIEGRCGCSCWSQRSCHFILLLIPPNPGG